MNPIHWRTLSTDRTHISADIDPPVFALQLQLTNKGDKCTKLLHMIIDYYFTPFWTHGFCWRAVPVVLNLVVFICIETVDMFRKWKKKKKGGVTPAHELQAKQKFNDDFVRQTLSSLKFCVSRYVCERNHFLYRCCFLIALHPTWCNCSSSTCWENEPRGRDGLWEMIKKKNSERNVVKMWF